MDPEMARPAGIEPAAPRLGGRADRGNCRRISPRRNFPATSRGRQPTKITGAVASISRVPRTENQAVSSIASCPRVKRRAWPAETDPVADIVADRPVVLAGDWWASARRESSSRQRRSRTPVFRSFQRCRSLTAKAQARSCRSSRRRAALLAIARSSFVSSWCFGAARGLACRFREGEGSFERPHATSSAFERPGLPSPCAGSLARSPTGRRRSEQGSHPELRSPLIPCPPRCQLLE